MKHLLLLTTIAASLLAGVTAKADSFAILYEGPGVMTSSVQPGPGGVIGIETFNAVSTGFRNSPVTATSGNQVIQTNFGTGGSNQTIGDITGVYSGGTNIRTRTVFGGASLPGNPSANNSRFIEALGTTSGTDTSPRPNNFPNSYTLTLTTHNGIPGVNYFGFWLSALDAGNELQFFNGNTLVGTFSPHNLISALGACPGSRWCGNPTPPFLNQNTAEQYAFVNFVDTSGFFNRVVFTQSAAFSGARYESDNHTVGFCPAPMNCITGTPVPTPEPSSFGLVGTALLGNAVFGLAGMARRKLGT